jgi:hypothetical protein
MEAEARAQAREKDLKEEMSRRVKTFVEACGRRPQLAEIHADTGWRAVYEELNALRARDGKHTHTQKEAHTGGKPKKGEAVSMRVVLPEPLPDVPAGVKDGKGAVDGTLALPAAMHLCFPDLFPTMTCARRSARRGGDPKIYRAASAGPEGSSASGRDDAGRAGAQELTCRDRVAAGEALLLLFRRAPPGTSGSKSDDPVEGMGKSTDNSRTAPRKAQASAARAGQAAAQKLDIVMEDEHMAIVIKPPSLLTIPLGSRGTMDVKTLLPNFLTPVPSISERSATTPAEGHLSPDAEAAADRDFAAALRAHGLDKDAEEILRACGVAKATDVLHIDDDDAEALGLSEQVRLGQGRYEVQMRSEMRGENLACVIFVIASSKIRGCEVERGKIAIDRVAGALEIDRV